MRAIVLVGGAGTRLLPLTHHTPKALVPILNRPLLERLLGHLRSHGVTEVTLAMTQRNEAIPAAIGDGSALDLAIDYAYEETPLGSGGAIASIVQSWPELPREPFLVVNGDIITDLDISAMVEAHREHGAELTISLHEVKDPSSYGVVALAERSDGDGAGHARIERFVEKPSREDAPSRLVNAGTWVFEPALVAGMDATTFNRVEDGLFPELATAGRPIFGFHRPSYWIDVGDPRAYRRVNGDLAAGAIPSMRPPEAAGSILRGPGTEIARSATLGAPAVIGESCVIEADARVDDSVLWDGVRIGAGAEVRRSVLASGVTVGAGAVLESAVVGHGAVIAAGERLPSGAVVEPDPHYNGDYDGGSGDR